MALRDDARSIEDALRRGVLTGRLIDLRSGDVGADDPANGENWDARRTVPAGLLADLLTRANETERPRALRLSGARIIGALDLESAELVCPASLVGCWFDEPVNLNGGNVLTLELRGCYLPGLRAVQMSTRGDLRLDQGFTVRGQVVLLGARIGGQLRLDGAMLDNPDEPALVADRLTVDQDMFCSFGLSIRGEIRLVGARIGGQLILDGATLDNPHGPALSAERLTVDGGMFCGDGFRAQGGVYLSSAHIGGNFDLNAASLIGRNEPALGADGLTVGGGMFCGDGFRAYGGVRLSAAHIGGNLVLDAAQLENPLEPALGAYALTVDGGMFCRDLAAMGEVDLVGARIGGQLSFYRAIVVNPDGQGLNLQNLGADTLDLRLERPPESVDLARAKVSLLIDDAASWPKEIRLRGFTYDALLERPSVSAAQRLSWLARDPAGYAPQPFEQLTSVYRSDGREQDAREIAIANHHERRRRLPLFTRFLTLDSLVGYGYRNWVAVAWLLIWWAIGTVVFSLAHPRQMALAKPEEAHPAFNPAIYSLDVLLPGSEFNQQPVWIAEGGARWWAWACTVAGWILATALIASLTGVLRRD